MEVTFEDSGTPLKRSKNRKGETCKQQLRRMCKTIAEEITSGKTTRLSNYDSKCEVILEAGHFMDAVYDIRYLVDSRKEYMGAQIMCAGGGPTIWVDTFREQVTGWWGTDKVQIYFQDNLGLNDYCEEIYGH